jgi:cell division protein FtsA
MIRNISIGIDVGSTTTRVIVGEFLKGESNPKIIGIGESNTEGVRNGYVVEPTLTAHSIKEAVAGAEKTSGLKIHRAFISIGGISLRGDTGSGMSIVSKADGEVTSTDIKNAIADCENNLNLTNKKVIQEFPISYRLDGKDVLGRLEGMRGTKLEVKALFVTCSIQHLEDLLEAMALANIEPIDIIASPVAASLVALSERQKIVGSVLVNIGAETTSMSVFENGLLVSLQTSSIGSEEITNDIALGLKIPLEKAEELKLGGDPGNFSKKKLDEIIGARLSDIFEVVENHLKKIKRSGLLPAGAIFVGGGANTPMLLEFSKSSLNLPSSIGATEIFGNAKTKLRDPSWFTVLGLIWGSTGESSDSSNSLGKFFKDFKNTMKSSIKQLMP